MAGCGLRKHTTQQTITCCRALCLAQPHRTHDTFQPCTFHARARTAHMCVPHAGVLLKCFLEVSDRELYDKLVASAPPGSGHAAFVSERAELLLGQPGRLGLRTRCVLRCVLVLHGTACDVARCVFAVLSAGARWVVARRAC